jgi:CheY-like chemotaxis protein
MLESATRMAWSEIKHRARFVTDFQAAPHVHGDQSQLAQVIVNLLINAAQAIPEGQRDKNEIRLTLKTDARGDAMIEVHDTGLGMAPEVMLRIFDPFFTTKPVGVGTGLGLSISDNLIESHGGKLTVQSSLGKGTTFRVSLPKAEAPTPIPPTIYSAPPPAALAQRARVLAVDDEPKVGAVISRALAPDHDVTVVTGGSEALALFRKGMRFDIVFCDLMMPCMSGPELHEQLQKEFPQQAECMVFLTGGVFTPRMATFLESIPSNRRVSKPFPLDLLHELVQKRLGSKR